MCQSVVLRLMGQGKYISTVFLLHISHMAEISKQLSSKHGTRPHGRDRTNVTCHVYKGLCENLAYDNLEKILKKYHNENIPVCEHLMNNKVIPRMGDYYLLKDNHIVNLCGVLCYIEKSEGKISELLKDLS